MIERTKTVKIAYINSILCNLILNLFCLHINESVKLIFKYHVFMIERTKTV